MDKINKIYRIHQLMNSRKRAVPLSDIQQTLECSRATAYRLVAEMRDDFKVPIYYDVEHGGYKYSGDYYELPGFWFNASEMLALLSTQKLLSEVGAGILDSQISPLKKKIENILTLNHINANNIHRIKILAMATRKPELKHFQAVASAVLSRAQLHISYHARGSDHETTRDISPQRLIHYRDNWYVDAWCHKRNELRNFAVDRIKATTKLETSAIDVPDEELDAHFAGAYGIFSGKATQTAILKFSSSRARWVADEVWHPQQQGKFLEDGQYELQIPYADSRELIMDIMRHVPEVEVTSPQILRDELKEKLLIGLQKYSE